MIPRNSREWKESCPAFARRFRQLVEESGLKRRAFAEKYGLSAAAVSNYCNGKHMPDSVRLKEIGEKLGKSADWLLGRDQK